jgi:uncharacterized protein (TIGR00255 family)
MTGFGAAEGQVGALRVSVELRTVNHRFFSPSIKLPPALVRWEGDVREALRKRVARGAITVYARVERDSDDRGIAIVDEERFGEYVAQLRALAARHGLSDTLDVATVLRLPDVLRTPSPVEEVEGSVAELIAIVEGAAVALTFMRDEEGDRVARVLLERIAVLDAAYERIAARAPDRLTEQRARTRAAVQELAESVTIDEQRMAQEIAFLVERLDVAEEIDRFRMHLAAFRSALTEPLGDPVGKRLGFLLQEMLREANTTGSKANDAPMLHDVVLVKEELERIREQVENVE